MIIYRKLEKRIVGTVDGKPFNLPKTKKVETKLKALEKASASEKDVMKFVKTTHNTEIAGSNKYLMYNPMTGEYFLKFENVRSDQAIPKVLVDFIEDSFDKDIDFLPILKAWARLLNNPRYNQDLAKYFATYLSTDYVDDAQVSKLMKTKKYTKEAATVLATYQDLAITKEGLLATYKVAEEVTWEWKMKKDKDGKYVKVRSDKYETVPAVIDPNTGKELKKAYLKRPKFKEDLVFTPAIWKNGDDFYSGTKLGYVYEIGKIQYLPKTAKRNLENTGGGGGLYIGGLNYIKHFKARGTHVLTCFVNPGDILSFQSDGHAIRTDAVFPHNVWEEDIPLKGIYHSSDYGRLSDARLAKLIKQAVKDGVDIREQQLKRG